MDNLVVACRALEFASPDDFGHQIMAMDEVRTDQSTARQVLLGDLLPKLRDMTLTPTGWLSQRSLAATSPRARVMNDNPNLVATPVSNIAGFGRMAGGVDHDSLKGSLIAVK
jgi:hypothetical protein